ncbi:hypothetical protein KM043_012945 [Ampulex compressa]|nr:hypothetical protein KM043_012945 [Ampulex compressa]
MSDAGNQDVRLLKPALDTTHALPRRCTRFRGCTRKGERREEIKGRGAEGPIGRETGNGEEAENMVGMARERGEGVRYFAMVKPGKTNLKTPVEFGKGKRADVE